MSNFPLTGPLRRLPPRKLRLSLIPIVNNFFKKSLDFRPFMGYIITMKESIYKVTLVNGPQTSIMPIKARDEAHAVRIAQNMGLGLVVRVDFACEESDS